MNGLDYFPGVHSRRWSGDASDDRGRNEKILELMKDDVDRYTYLISRFSLCNSEKELYRTSVRNVFTVAKEIHGENGFGYDSILIPSVSSLRNAAKYMNQPQLLKYIKAEDLGYSELIYTTTCTIADLTQEEKNAINNRGRIAKEISEFLGGYIG